MIRCYHESTELLDLAVASAKDWKNDPFLRKFFRIRPSLWIDKLSCSSEIVSTANGIQQHWDDFKFSVLDVPQLRKLDPLAHWNLDEFGLIELGSGYIETKPLFIALKSLLLNKGVIICEDILSEIVSLGQNKCIIKIDNKIIHTNLIISAVGAWTGKLLKSLALESEFPRIRTKAIQVNGINPCPPAIRNFCFVDAVYDLYGRQQDLGNGGFCGTSVFDWDIEPECSESFNSKKSSFLLWQKVIENRWPSIVFHFNEEISKCTQRSFDGFLPTGVGFVQQSQSAPRLIVTAGWSGSGFKVAPSIAKQVTTTAKLILQS